MRRESLERWPRDAAGLGAVDPQLADLRERTRDARRSKEKCAVTGAAAAVPVVAAAVGDRRKIRSGGGSQDRKSWGKVGGGGNGARPVVKKLAHSWARARTRAGLRSTTATSSAPTAYAIGDCALSGTAPTAQVAAQQGKYVVGPSATARSPSSTSTPEACCLGFGNAIAQLQPQHQAWRSLHSAANTKVVGEDQRAVTGAPAFALWRGMYFTQLLSPSTRWSVSADWIRTSLKGRDVNEPVLKRTMTPAESE